MAVSKTTIAAIRFGYGFHRDQAAPSGPGALFDTLGVAQRTPMPVPIAGLAERRKRLDALIAERKSGGKGPEFQEMRKAMRRDAMRDAAQVVFRRAVSPHGFYERLAAFWADHFTIAGRNAGQLFVAPTFEPEALRPHLMGSFGEMLSAVVQHPVMLSYLDQVSSFGPNSRAGKRRGKGLNENLAREVLELHTLGVGGPYAQRDVRELAELLTGYGVHRGFGKFRFFQQRAEPGAETVLGQSYGGDPAEASHALEFLQDVAVHEVTARHMASKLAVHFIADQPDPDLVAHIAAAWRNSGGDLPSVYQALLEHPASWRVPFAKIRQPSGLVAATMRAMGVTIQDLDGPLARGVRLVRALRDLGQPLLQPPGPDGWPEEAEAWITPQGLAARLSFAGKVGQLIARRSDVDPRRFAEGVLRDALRPETGFAVGGAPDRWEGFALVLASPEFNRR
ncbi:MAG: DUF1800 domain-containing protein [Pseudomonadota bacterium]